MTGVGPGDAGVAGAEGGVWALWIRPQEAVFPPVATQSSVHAHQPATPGRAVSTGGPALGGSLQAGGQRAEGSRPMGVLRQTGPQRGSSPHCHLLLMVGTLLRG